MMIKSPLTSLAAIALAVISLSVSAEPPSGDDGTGFASDALPPVEQLVQTRLISEVTSFVPGETFHLAVVFTIAEHWHIYWQSPGDAGAPTTLSIQGPNGFEIGEVMYPRPLRYKEVLGDSIGYENQAILFVPVTAPLDADARSARFEVATSFLVCRDACLFGESTLSIRLPRAESPTVRPAPSASHTDLIEKFHSRLPQPLEDLEGATFELKENTLVVFIPNAGEYKAADFFPIDVRGVRIEKAEYKQDRGGWTITAPVSIKPKNARGKPMAVRGLIALGDSLDDPSYAFEIPVTQAASEEE